MDQPLENYTIQIWEFHLIFLPHCSYKLPSIKSQQIRRTVETDVAVNFTEEQKASVAQYMARSTAVANQHYRMKTLDTVVATANLLSSLTRYVII